MNSIQLVGRLVKDAVFTTDQDGSLRCNFTLAVDRLTKRNNGRDMTSDFFDCTAFRKTAEAAGNYQRQYNGYRKGDVVSLTGRGEFDNYKDKNGQTVRRFQVIANELSCVFRKNPPVQQDGQQGYGAPAPVYQAPVYQASVYSGPGVYNVPQQGYPNMPNGQTYPTGQPNMPNGQQAYPAGQVPAYNGGDPVNTGYGR